MKVVVTGATGFIGRAVVVDLAMRGHDLTCLVRKAGSASDLPSKTVVWDPSEGASESLVSVLKEADAVVHLAGEPVAKSRWTSKVKNSIRASRVEGTKKIVEAIASLPPSQRPQVFLSASAIGVYGNRGQEILTEKSTAGEGFLSEVVTAWEAEAIKAESLGVRVVLARLGVVLGIGGGALEQMQPVVLGNGQQWMSWIHLEDVVSFVRFALERDSMSGVFNLVAPNPEKNVSFTRAFSKAMGIGPVLMTPSSVLKLSLGEMSSILLDSTRVVPERALEQGFRFRFERLSEALLDIYPAPLERRFSATQFVPRPVEEVFEYFSRAENLEEITPAWLNFIIVKTSTPQIETGTVIDYKLKIHGIPFRWRSRIEDWEPQKKFVDLQIKGPYAKWHHTHRFERVAGGTLVCDDVVYQLPVGRIGSLLGSRFVRADVAKIFSYRRSKIAQVFGGV